ncbi:MAG TPA: TldD/PmbA family protein [Acidimicrobiales bacterium]|nr:TldD/PmbA family protein [Acidimicrobiales bacterium]
MSELLALAEKVVAWSRPGEQVEAYLSRATDTEIHVYQGEVESMSSAASAGAGVRVVSDGRQGFAYVGSLDEGAMAEALQEARDNASFASPEPWVGLAEPDKTLPAELDLWREELACLRTEHKVATAIDLERQVRGLDHRITQVEWSRWGDVSSETAVASSLGVRASERATACYLSVAAVASDGSGSKQGHGSTCGRSATDLDPSAAASEAVHRAVRLLGAGKPRSAHVPVVFEPRVTAQLLSLVASALSGERVLKGTSLFADRLGEQVASTGITLVDDPTNAQAWGASAWDDEGLAGRRNLMIEDGVLRSYLYDTTAARRAGTSSTANAIRAGYKSVPSVGARAVCLVPGALSPLEVMAEVGDGLLVQSLSGVHSGVNPVSGDFSVGAEGLLVQGGAPGAPVREVTIASNLQRMLQGVVAVGSDLEWRPSSAAGLTLAISEMSMSGV